MWYHWRGTFWQSSFFWFMFLALHLHKAENHQPSLLGWVKLNLQPMSEPVITWIHEKYLFLFFICCETVIMGKCASGLDLSHLWNYDQPFSSACRLIVSSVLLVQHCPLTFLFFLCLSRQTTVVHRRCQSVVIYSSTLNICLHTFSKLSIDVSHLSNLPTLWTSLFTHTLYKYIKI